MIGIQEMNSRLEKQEAFKDLQNTLKEMQNHAYFDYEEANIFGTGRIQREEGISPMAADDAKAISESIRTIPMREFLAKSGTTGIAGGAYLIPTKIYNTLFEPAAKADIMPDISLAVLPAEQLPGTQTKVDIVVDGSMLAWSTSSGASAPTETVATTQATLDFSNTYTVHPRITNDLIEDSQWDLIEMHIRMAGKVCGEKSAELAATVLYTATDGDGTKNQITGDQAYTEWATDAASHTVEEAILANQADGWNPDTILLTHKAFIYNIKGTAGISNNESSVNDDWLHSGYPSTLGGLNCIYSDIDYLNAAAAKAVIFSKDFSLLSGRKRWLRVENYAEPIKDLQGATVSFRQDSVTVYNDAIAPYVEGS